MATQNEMIQGLVADLKANPKILNYAQNFGNALVAGTKDHCAATLSALLVFAGIYPTNIGTGNSNLEIWVPTLVADLENINNWTRINLGNTINIGDVGVVMLPSGVHHIYLVIDPTNQAVPMIADNQEPIFHPRPVAGEPAKSYSPTTFFLRAQ